MEQLITISRSNELDELLAHIDESEFLSFDIETTGLTKDSQIIGFSICGNSGKAYYVVTQYWDGTNLKPLIQFSEAQMILHRLKNKNLIMHNCVFDCSMVESYYGISLIDYVHTDTMILAHLLDENRKVGLKELGRTYFGDSADEEQRLMKESIVANGGKVTKLEYELFKADHKLVSKYGAKDALLTFKLFHTLTKELELQDLTKFFYEEESMPLLKGPTYQLNTSGLKIDMDNLRSLKKQLQSECAEMRSLIDKEIHPYVKDKYPGTTKAKTFNMGSPTQLSWLIFGQLGVDFGFLTDEGKKVCNYLDLSLPYTNQAKRAFIAECSASVGKIYQPGYLHNGKQVNGKKIRDPWFYLETDKVTLAKLANKYDWINLYLKHQAKIKILNTYVEGIEERVQYGIIYPSFLQHGTTSGRYSSRSPNFQNLPKKEKSVKKAIVAREGKVFVGADYSQLEPRIFACVSQDPALMATFDSGEDFYSVIGMKVYGKSDCHAKKDGTPDSFATKYSTLRDYAKVICLASVYGASARQLAPQLKKNIEETMQDIEDYFEQFPKVRDMMLKSHESAKLKGFVKNMFGRPRRIPLATRIPEIYGKNTKHESLPYAQRYLLNLAVNHRIQSTAASVVNRSAIQLTEYFKELNINAKIVLQVHDSLVVECDEKDATNVFDLLQDAMENTIVLPGVKLEAKPQIGKNLSEV